MLEDWVSLGKEMEEIWRPVEVWFGGGKLLNFWQREGGGNCSGSHALSGCCTQMTKGVEGEEMMLVLLGSLEATERELWI